MGLALRRTAEHRWRQICVPISAFVFLVFLLAAASVVQMVMRQDDRAATRSGYLATIPAPTDLFILERPDAWQGRIINVVWLEPATPAVSAPVLPPGVHTLPAPGQAVVSPALGRLILANPALGERYRDHVVLPETAVRDGGELIAYVRPPDGRVLEGGESALRVEAGRIVGDGPVLRVGGFGSPAKSVIPVPVGDPYLTAIGPIVGGLTAVLIIPGIIVLAVGITAASQVRDHRFAVLRSIGASRKTLIELSAAEILLLAAPGLAAAVILWAIIGPLLGTVPFVGYEVVPGDLGLPWWLLLAQFGAAAAVTAAISAALTAVASRRPTRPRPGPQRRSFTAFRAVPLAASVMAFLISKLNEERYWAADLHLIGIVTAVASVPIVLPAVLPMVGYIFARGRSIQGAIVGRNMQWDPTRALRPFVGGAALVVLTLIATGYVTLNRHSEAPPRPAGPGQAVVVQWRDAQPHDVIRLAAGMDGALVVPFVEGEPHHGVPGGGHTHDASAGVLSLGATCVELAQFFPQASCESSAPGVLPEPIQNSLALSLSVASRGPVRQIRLVPRAELGTLGSAIVIDDRQLEALDKLVRDVAMTMLPAPYVRSLPGLELRESPLVPWIINGGIVAALGLALACLLALVDRLQGRRRDYRHLLSIGISRRQLAALRAWTFAAPYGTAFGSSFLAGLAMCVLLVVPAGIAMPWTVIVSIASAVIALGVLGTVTVAFLDMRPASEKREYRAEMLQGEVSAGTVSQ